jgi:hypothetical protein
MYRQMDSQMDRQMGRRKDRKRRDEQTDEQTFSVRSGGWVDEQMDGHTDRQIELPF